MLEPLSGCALLLLPLLLLAALPVLMVLAWQERWRPCPLCGQRGTLEPIEMPQTQEADEDWMTRDWTTPQWSPQPGVLHCSACGLHLRQLDLDALTRRTPDPDG